MPTVNVNVQPEIFHWVLKQIDTEKLGEKLLNNITQWLNGTKNPTFNQIENLSKKTNIPLGYFFLQTPPAEQIDLLEYRTVDNIQFANPSRNLIDLIREMETVQDWMQNYRQDMGFDMLSVVGCMSRVKKVNDIVGKIRKDLEIQYTWYENCADIRESFAYIRKRLEACGVVVMMSGIVGKNPHRALDVDEFRAFAMVNKWAPLIFINAADSNGARLFSLLHETAHIWLGEDDLYNDRQNKIDGVSEIETICNAVAGELIVPTDIFLNKWDIADQGEDIHATIAELVKSFRCSEVVLARKALDYGKINQNIYYKVVNAAINHYNQMKQNKESSGGNYYNTMGSRLDGCFVRALCESIQMGRTSYTEAFRLTNTTRKTFSDVVQLFGGVEC